MLKAAEKIQKNHLAVKGLELNRRNFKTLSKAQREKMIIIDSNKMNLDWARMAVSEMNDQVVIKGFPVIQEHVPSRTKTPAKRPAH